jgi:SAM-dependent methyltransferase
MNWYHRHLCSSEGWEDFMAGTVVPAVLAGAELGDNVLEVGPGYGAGTRSLLSRTARLTVLERDPDLVARLRVSFGDGLTVVHGDATSMPWDRATFSAVVCFTMLHHLSSPVAQDRLFAEAARVLIPAGVFAGADSRSRLRFRVIHLGDTCTPVAPSGLAERLRRAGFIDPVVHAEPRAVRFVAHAPSRPVPAQ